MTEQIRLKLLSLRDLAVTAGPFALVASLLLGLAYWWIDPAPPRQMVIATGPENGDYHVLGKRYQQALARHGIRADLRITQGSRENLSLLLDPASKVTVAFMRSGTTSGVDLQDQPLTSLGSLFFEPVWLFHRDSVKLDAVAQLKGMNVEIGTAGNGSARIIEALLRENGLALADIKPMQSEQTQAVLSLLEGRADALALVSAPESQMVRMLLRTPGIRLMPLPQAQAYARKMGDMSAVALPRGMIDFASDLPPADIPMIAPTATLVHNEQAHPATIDLLIQAAHDIHSQPSWFADARKFPTLLDTELPVSKEASRFYRAGPPFLQRYLPFWMANLVDRMWVVLLSIGALLIPLSRIVPPLYQWRIRSRIYRWYGQLKDVEQQTRVPQPERSRRLDQDMMERLDDIEDKVNDLNVPLSHADEVYHLRAHIAMVRARLKAAPLGVTGSAPTSGTGAQPHPEPPV